jgi:hypothetical protein
LIAEEPPLHDFVDISLGAIGGDIGHGGAFARMAAAGGMTGG